MAKRIRYKGVWRNPLTNKELEYIAKTVLEDELAQWEKYNDNELYPNPFEEDRLAQELKFFIDFVHPNR